MEGPKFKGAKSRATVMANVQTFKVEPLSNKTDETLWPEQITII